MKENIDTMSIITISSINDTNNKKLIWIRLWYIVFCILNILIGFYIYKNNKYNIFIGIYIVYYTFEFLIISVISLVISAITVMINNTSFCLIYSASLLFILFISNIIAFIYSILVLINALLYLNVYFSKSLITFVIFKIIIVSLFLCNFFSLDKDKNQLDDNLLNNIEKEVKFAHIDWNI